MLEMKTECERCQTALLNDATSAYICSFECTFCAPCVEELATTCPNCGGNLAQRPTRALASG